MLSSSLALDSVAIVLYQPQDLVNVAAIIRVMSNFGLSDLRLVEPAAYDPYRIEGIAHHTQPLINATRRFPTLDAALFDCRLVLGTTGRPRERERLRLTPRTAAPYLLDAARTQQVALLFGSEQDGLPNDALDRCHGMITIPTHLQNRSLNLAQAALVVAYELWMAASRGSDSPIALAPGPSHQSALLPLQGGAESVSPSPEVAGLANGREREALFTAVEGLLEALYPAGDPRRLEGAMGRLRSLLMRAHPRTEEAAALTNLMRHAARALREQP